MRESVRCRATCRQSKEPCKNQAIKGATVCRMHGGSAPQVRQKASGRLAIQQLLRDGKPRSAQEAMLDAHHVADAVMRDKKLKIEAGDTVSPTDVQELMDAVQRLAVLSKMVVDARADEHLQQQLHMEAGLMVRVLNVALDAAGLDPDQEVRARLALRQELMAIDAERNGEMRVIEGTISQNHALSGGSTS